MFIRTKTQQINQVAGGPGFAPSSGMVKRFLEGNSPASRAKQRQTLGTLRQLTVQPSTRARYDKAVNLFLQFLKDNGLALPRVREHLDTMVCDYLEYIFGRLAPAGL